MVCHVYLKSKRIATIENSKVTISSIDSITQTSVFINRTKFQNIIQEQLVSENLFELKRIGSEDILSAYYKKGKSTDQGDETKGITINIKDHPHKKESSIITVYGADNQYQSLIITWNILLLNHFKSKLNLFKTLSLNHSLIFYVKLILESFILIYFCLLY